MPWNLAVVIARPVIRAWLKHASHSWRRLPMPNDSPHVHAPGANPDRLLLTGDGASAGRGVLSHDLGLAGYLARRVSELTHRATDVDIVVSGPMTAALCTEAISPLDLSRFDAVILSVGVNEALALDPLAHWDRAIVTLIERIQRDAPASVEILVLSVPLVSSNQNFPRVLATLVDAHSARLNRITREVCARHPRTTFVEFNPSDSHEYRGAHTYERWAGMLAPWVSAKLPPVGADTVRHEEADEPARQRALTSMGILDSAPEESFDQITETAQNLFGVSMAAVTFIDETRQWMKSARGLPRADAPRGDSFCDITIRRAQHFAIEDTSLDPRFADNPFATGPAAVRFYAGYPIESPDGQRVGALCIMDSKPRGFSATDAALLRSLALRVQRLIWGDQFLPAT